MDQKIESIFSSISFIKIILPIHMTTFETEFLNRLNPDLKTDELILIYQTSLQSTTTLKQFIKSVQNEAKKLNLTLDLPTLKAVYNQAQSYYEQAQLYCKYDQLLSNPSCEQSQEFIQQRNEDECLDLSDLIVYCCNHQRLDQLASISQMENVNKTEPTKLNINIDAIHQFASQYPQYAVVKQVAKVLDFDVLDLIGHYDYEIIGAQFYYDMCEDLTPDVVLEHISHGKHNYFCYDIKNYVHQYMNYTNLKVEQQQTGLLCPPYDSQDPCIQHH